MNKLQIIKSWVIRRDWRTINFFVLFLGWISLLYSDIFAYEAKYGEFANRDMALLISGAFRMDATFFLYIQIFAILFIIVKYISSKEIKRVIKQNNIAVIS